MNNRDEKQNKPQLSAEMENYPVLKEMTVIELAQLRLKAKKYEQQDPGFLRAIDAEFKRRQHEKS
jgi:hypothetical protein